MKLAFDSFVSFSPAPVRFVECFGVLFAITSVLWGIVLILSRLSGAIEISGWTTLMVVILFSSGMIMLSLGILGEYIWRTLDVAQHRPVFFVEEDLIGKNEHETDEKNE